MSARSLSKIALEIRQDWKKVAPYAEPYLNAMRKLDTINDKYYLDSGRDIVLRFLSNASGWRGEKAKEIKKELKSLCS